jgi:hypothetical protein
MKVGKRSLMMSPALPTVKLGEHDISRLIIGGNPFSGGSHTSVEMDRAFLDYQR